MYEVILDTADPNDQEFKLWLEEHGIVAEDVPSTGIQNNIERRYSSCTVASLGLLIETHFNDGTGDLRYLTDLVRVAGSYAFWAVVLGLAIALTCGR